MAAVCLGDVDLLPDAEMGGVPFLGELQGGRALVPRRNEGVCDDGF